MRKTLRYIIVTAAILFASHLSAANSKTYLLEFGVQAGTSYYVGDLHEHIFMCPRYAAGAHVSYKFDRRWSLTAKSEFCRIAFTDASGLPENHMINTDLTAEYNFFRFDISQYDPKIKPITPYIALGLGLGIYGRDDENNKHFYNSALYFPFVIGMKWQMSPHWSMKIAWQHQLYVGRYADRVENNDLYDNTYELNKANILRNDLVSTLTMSICCSFIAKREKCMLCEEEKRRTSNYSNFGGLISIDVNKRNVKRGAPKGGRIAQ